MYIYVYLKTPRIIFTCTSFFVNEGSYCFFFGKIIFWINTLKKIQVNDIIDGIKEVFAYFLYIPKMFLLLLIVLWFFNEIIFRLTLNYLKSTWKEFRYLNFSQPDKKVFFLNVIFSSVIKLSNKMSVKFQNLQQKT